MFVYTVSQIARRTSISGRKLWTTVRAHGFIDTFGVARLYFGWDS